MNRVQKGFTLIELMIVIAIVGILAAVALPAYQDYTVRAKTSEAMALLGEAKTTIAEYYISNGELPSTVAKAGLRTNIETDNVNSVTWSSLGIITVEVNDIGGSTGAATTNSVSFSLTSTSSGTPQWKCIQGTNGMETKYLPANCRG
ncbi:MAG: type IV pilus assembly protein PilA [Halieaceae bacterium]|jgi:type IV pilus assembly protein PilA